MIVPLLLALAVVIAGAKVGGWVSSRLGQPAVLGELLVGLLLGPSVVDLFGQPYFAGAHVTETLHQLGEVGVIFLMFAAGLEIHLSDMAKMGKTAVWVGVLGVILPILLGTVTVLPFGYALDKAIFVGIVLSATSVSISAQTLMELGRLRSREGLTLLGAAVVDDVLAIAILSGYVALAASEGGGIGELIGILTRMFLFLGVAFVTGMWLLPKIGRWAEKLHISQPIMSVTLVVVLLFAWASEFVGGVATITGAFVAGVSLSRSNVKDDIDRGIRVLSYAFFVPIFLVGIGLTADARTLSGSDVGLTIAVCLVAVVSKLIGAGLGARAGGMAWQEALCVGVGMISRGEVGLIVAGVGVSSGIINTGVFTVVVVMVLVTTLITPPLLRMVFGR